MTPRARKGEPQIPDANGHATFLRAHLGRVVALSYYWESSPRNVVGTVRSVTGDTVVLRTTREPVRDHCISLASIVATRTDAHAGKDRPDHAHA